MRITNNGLSTFTGTIGFNAVSPCNGDFSQQDPVTLNPGDHVSIEVDGEASNQGGYNSTTPCGETTTPQNGPQFVLNGTVTLGSSSQSIQFSIFDKDIHSGTSATNPFGVTLDNYILQGGDPFGRDTGDGFEESQAPGSFQITPANTGPTSGETVGGGIDFQTTCTGCPVNTATGEFHRTFSDLRVPGRGLALDLTRTYSSSLAGQDSRFGFGWADSYGWFLSTDATSGDVTVHAADGAAVVFVPDGSGGFSGPSHDFASLAQDSSTGDFTYARDTGESYLFNSAGRLIEEQDRNGYATRLAYSAGKLTAVTDPAGRSLSFGYGSNGKVATVTDPAGRRVSYSYDSAGDLVSVVDAGGGKWALAYDSAHRLVKLRDPRGGVMINGYDASGRVTSWRDPAKRTTTLSYVDNGNGSQTTTETDARGDVTDWDYQSLELMSVTRGAGTSSAATTSYTYDPATLGVASVTNPDGNTTTYTYDARGDLLSATDPLGRTTSYTYNGFGEVLTSTDPLGVTTTNTYGTRGNLRSSSTPVGSQTATARYAHADRAHPGDITAMTNPDGHTWSYTYDANGDRVSATNPLGDKTTYAYNKIGERTSTRTPLGHVTHYTYSTLGQIRATTDALGHKTVNSYDHEQNLVKVIDPNGNVTLHTYNLDSEPTKTTVESASGSVLSSESTGYDAAGNVSAQVNGLGKATSYAYDSLDREVSSTDPNGRTTSYGYDGAGNRTSLTDPSGRTTSYGYDADNELISVSYSDGSTPNATFTYDAGGQRTGMTDGSGSTTYSYDALRRLTADKQGNGATVAYGYDLAGNLTSLTYPNGKTVTRAYDAAGRLSAVSDWLAHTTRFSYDPDGNLTSEAYPNGILGTFSYDGADRLTHTTDTSGATTLLDLAYSRDNTGLITGENTTSYAYDGANRLTSSTTGPHPMGYDQANEITAIGNEALAYDPSGELTSLTHGASTTTYTYDPQGDRTTTTPPTGASTTYRYDQANRLTAYHRGTTTASYAYNGDGLRTSKTVGNTTTSYTWDISQDLPLILKAGRTSYLSGPGGLPIEQIAGTAPLYYHHDQLGSTRLVTTQTGAIAATYSYSPYGTIATHTGASTPLGYAGQYRDNETRLIYLRARYYDPISSQFVTLDPAVQTTKGPFSYSGDSPTNNTDPTGMDYCPPGDPDTCLPTPDYSACQGGQWDGEFAVASPGGACMHTLQRIVQNVGECTSIDDCTTALNDYTTELRAFSPSAPPQTPDSAVNCDAFKYLKSEIPLANLKGNQLNTAIQLQNKSNCQWKWIDVGVFLGITTGGLSSIADIPGWAGAAVGGGVSTSGIAGLGCG